jgi:small-conductance mechanosensitive channel
MTVETEHVVGTLLTLMAPAPFPIGDHIMTGGVEGTIVLVNIVCSELEAPDGIRVIMPNDGLWGRVRRR